MSVDAALGDRCLGRPPTADEASGIYHTLNGGKRREPVFHKMEDFEALERLMVEALERSPIKLFPVLSSAE